MSTKSHLIALVNLLRGAAVAGLLMPCGVLAANPDAEPGTQLPSESQQTERVLRGQDLFREAYRLWQAKEYEKVVAMVLPLAEEGNASAQFLMGGIYSKGEGVPQSDEMAVKWWRKSAVQGVPDAQNELGVALLDGTGVIPDPVEAVMWYRRAADAGLPVAQVNLGLAYWEGRGVPRDAVKAVSLFRKAAEQNLGWAQFYLGSAYAQGIGVAKSIPQAITWWLKAAEQDYSEAQYILGRVYLSGVGVRVDYSRSAYWFARAARRGHVGAETNLQFVLRHLHKSELRAATVVRAKPESNSAVIRSARPGEVSYELGRSRDWMEVYLEDRHTLGYISAGQARKP